jgi:hypothetical protein
MTVLPATGRLASAYDTAADVNLIMRRICEAKGWRFERRLCKEKRLASVVPAAAARHFFGRAMIARETRNVVRMTSSSLKVRRS